MDFFQTREKYRKKEIQTVMNLLIKGAVMGLCLWGGWQWGSIEQRRLQADANLAIYENNLQIQTLRREKQRLEHQLSQINAQEQAEAATTRKTDNKLTRLIKGQIARGTEMEQIYQMLQSLGQPVNCRITAEKSVAVATELYSGMESNINLFDGGLALHIEGRTQANGPKSEPWFDPSKPISVRLVYLGSQKVVQDILPISTVLPAEDWLVKIDITEGELRGYVDLSLQHCALR